MGLLNVVVMIPILFIFDVTGFEDLQIPDLNYTLIMIPQAFAAILIVYCWAKAVGGLGANLAASTYTLTTLPFIIVLDFYFDDDIYGQITNMYILGAFLVLSAFFTISVMELYEEVHILRLEKLQEK
jgi:drug/metabolite transporter (DMT)-like permease